MLCILECVCTTVHFIVQSPVQSDVHLNVLSACVTLAKDCQFHIHVRCVALNFCAFTIAANNYQLHTVFM